MGEDPQVNTDKNRARRKLRRAHQSILDAQAAEVEAVAEAREAGATWVEIGEDVGMAGPNAHRKYAPLLEANRSGPAHPDQT